MTPETAFNWVTIYSLLIAVTLGAIAFAGPLYKYLKDAFKLLGLPVMFLGVIMVSSPKWTEVAIKFRDFEGKIATLEADNTKANTQIAKLEKEKEEQGKTFASKLAELSSKPKSTVTADATVLAAFAGVPSDGFVAYKPLSDEGITELLTNLCNKAATVIEDNEVIEDSVDCEKIGAYDFKLLSQAIVKNFKQNGISLYAQNAALEKYWAGVPAGASDSWLLGGNSTGWNNVIEAVAKADDD